MKAKAAKATVTAKPAIFLDRDGTLVRDVRHSADPERLEILVGAAEALAGLHAAGFRLVVVTNQSGVARGAFTLAEAEAMGEALRRRFASLGVPIDGYYFCPHYPGGCVAEFSRVCGCRKPMPGLIAAAAADAAEEEGEPLDLRRSWMVGDSLSDAAAGVAAGVRAIVVDIGRPDVGESVPEGVLLARNLPHAAAIILRGAVPLPAAALASRSGVEDCRLAGEPSQWPDARWATEARREATSFRRGCLKRSI